VASLSSLAKEYADYLAMNRFDAGASTEILRRINRLTYVTSQRPLTPEVRRQLVEDIADELFPPRRVPGTDLTYVEEAEDSTELHKLIALLRDGVGASS